MKHTPFNSLIYFLALLAFVLGGHSTAFGQGKVEWIQQCYGDNVEMIADLNQGPNDHTSIVGIYRNDSLLICNYQFLPNEGTFGPSSYVVNINETGSCSWGHALHGVLLSSCTQDKDGNTYVGGYGDRSSIKLDSISILNSGGNIDLQALVMKFDSTGLLVNSEILSNSTTGFCSDIYHNAKTGNLYETYLTNFTDTFFLSDTFVDFNSEEWSCVVAQRNKDYEITKLIPIVADYRIDVYSTLAEDKNGNILIAGSFRGSKIRIFDTEFDYPLHGTNVRRGFLIKIDSDYNIQWLKIFDSDQDFLGIADMEITNNGILVSGTYDGQTLKIDDQTFRGSSLPLINWNYNWQTLLDENGNPIWTKFIESNTTKRTFTTYDKERAHLISHWTLRDDSATIFGQKFIKLNKEKTDAILTIQDVDGDLIWSEMYGGEHTEVGVFVDLAQKGDIIITGLFESDSLVFLGDTLFNDSPLDQHNNRPSNIFVARISLELETSLFDVFPDLETLDVFPNPNYGSFQISDLSIEDKIKIYSTSAKEVDYIRDGDVINISNPKPGIYVLILKSKEGDTRYGKIIVN